MFQTKGVVERLNGACGKAANTKDINAAYKILEDAIAKEVQIVEAIIDMPGFKAWLEGDRFDLMKVRGRKTK